MACNRGLCCQITRIPILISKTAKTMTSEFMELGIPPVAGIDSQCGFFIVCSVTDMIIKGRIIRFIAFRKLCRIRPVKRSASISIRNNTVRTPAGVGNRPSAIAFIVDNHQDRHLIYRLVSQNDLRAMAGHETEYGVCIRSHIIITVLPPEGSESCIMLLCYIAFSVLDRGSSFS